MIVFTLTLKYVQKIEGADGKNGLKKRNVIAFPCNIKLLHCYDLVVKQRRKENENFGR